MTDELAEIQHYEVTATEVKLVEVRRVDECPGCHRRGYYWNLSNNRRQCRGKKCLTMWRIGDV